MTTQTCICADLGATGIGQQHALCPAHEALECLDGPRCDKHWEKRLDAEEETTRKYGSADSDCPPPGFDPAYAGERWDDEY